MLIKWQNDFTQAGEWLRQNRSQKENSSLSTVANLLPGKKGMTWNYTNLPDTDSFSSTVAKTYGKRTCHV